MSVILQSNKQYTGEKALPSYNQILTSASQVMSDYSSRVLADGGVINSPSITQKTINFIFTNNLFGRMEVCASPFFGRKLDSNGNVLKLYSIDGEDLETVAIGTGAGAKPTISATGGVLFAAGAVSTDANGHILSTATKRARSKNGRMALSVAIKSVKNTGLASVAAFTTHGVPPLSSDIFSVLTQALEASNPTMGRVNLNLAGAYAQASAMGSKLGNTATVYAKQSPNFAKLYVNGAEVDIPVLGVSDGKVFNNEYYVDFGGIMRGVGTGYSAGVEINSMMLIGDARPEQAIALDLFVKNTFMS